MEREEPPPMCLAAMQESYDEGVTDEFVKPIVIVDEAEQASGNYSGG